MGISHVLSTVLLKAFPSDPARSEKSGVQIIPLSLYFFKSHIKIVSSQYSLREGKKSGVFCGLMVVFQLSYVSNFL